MNNEFGDQVVEEAEQAPSLRVVQPAAPQMNEFGDQVVEDPGTTAARGKIIDAAKSNPEDAAKAIPLGAKLNVPSTLVEKDVPKFQQESNRRDAIDIAEKNPAIADFVNSHPLAAKIANDDFPKLDAVAGAVGKIGTDSILGTAVKAFKDTYDAEGFEAERSKFSDALAANPAFANIFIRQATLAGASLASGGMRAFTGLVTGAAAAIAEHERQYGMSAADSQKLAQDLIIFANVGLSGQGGLHGPLHPTVHAAMAEAVEAGRAAEPHVLAGKEPPVGAHEALDDIKVDQAKTDKKNLSGAVAEASGSKLRERNPDMFADYIRGITDGNIGISADAVRTLYGDKVPAADDGILGHVVPDLAAKLERAEATGGDVQVPLADWLAKVEPDVAKELQDHIRARPEGMTVEEGKEHETPEGVAGTPVDSIRQASGLQGVQERKLELRRTDTAPTKDGDLSHTIELHNAEGYQGHINVTEEAGGKRLYVDDIGSFQGPGSVGPRALRDVLEQLREQFPNAETLEGMRVSGAREKAGIEDAKDLKTSIDLTKIKPRAKAQPERIKSAAIKIGDRTFEGIIHSDAWQEAAKTISGIKHNTETGETIGPSAETGFTTTTGRFVNREEALKIASAQTQLNDVPAPDHLPQDRLHAAQLSVENVDKDAFEKASAIGMTVDQYKRYQKLIDKRQAEDVAYYTKRAEAEAKQRLGKEWKDTQNELRPQVAEQINSRPDVAADAYLRDGNLFGQDVAKVKIGEAYLTPEQKAGLPKDFVAKEGMHPDDLAGLVGEASGTDLIEALSKLNAAREASGMNPTNFRRRMIAAELESQVQARLGKRAEEILAEAKDQVLSQTQEQMLHEEVLARAAEAGLEYSIKPDELKASLKDYFDRQQVKEVSSDKGIAEAGRAGRAAEMALLKGDYAEAFRQKQRQFNAFVMAKYAKAFEKGQAQFEKLAKRFEDRVLPSVAQDYTNWVHSILMQMGEKVKRSPADLAQSIANTEHPTLEDFVDAKQTHDMREVPVAEFLMDPAFKKATKDLTVSEFGAMHDSIKALAENGRDEQKLVKAGEEYDLNEKKREMIAQLETFKEKHYDASGGRWLGPLPPSVARPLRTYLVSHLQLESIFNRWDRGDSRGVFTQFIARELATAANGEAALEREFSTKLRSLADKADLKERVPNDLFLDPSAGTSITMNRKNLRAVLLNVGNKSNFDKLARGYIPELAKGEEGKAQVATFQAQIMDWLHQHATKQDWDWAQGIGDIFADIKKKSDTMYRSMTGGVEPENIPLAPIDTPHGKYDGWYYPVVYHPVWEGASKKLMGGDALEQSNYVRATTPAGYTKQRTGYAAPMALDLDMMPVRMRQMLHDIAFRPSVIQAGKIFYDKDVRQAITAHYGAEYTKMLVPYLQDVANAANYRNDAQQVFTRFSETMRQNVIATLIGLNPGTVMKHGPTAAVNSISEVGAMNFLRAAKGLFSINEATGETNWAFAMKTSEELQRRQRFYKETLGGATEEIQGESSLRDSIIALGAKPVAMSDLLSAVPTWMAKYEAEMKDHGVHGDAMFEADRAVRRAHGSSVVTNRPQVMRTGAMGSWLASLYGFFNHIMNRQYEMAWHAGDTLDMVKKRDYKEAMAEIPKLSGQLFSYVIFPALVEELVTPVTSKEGDSWGKTAAKGLAYSVSASWIGVRDIVNAAVNGRDPSIGLLSTAYKTITDAVRDVNKDQPMSKRNAGMLIQHSATALGAVTGMMPAQVGKAARFSYDVGTGQERPAGPWGWMTGLRYGTMKNHPDTFEHWRKGH